ncbi:PREDICTED: protein kintoun [Polistes canadensis]|uniref:protein kintoun n=1 Tax=Polistes canadensis TaxID=91411 RepID=UPI000718C054|nr:PREDICTED: protein kintoun [Polistes canadensis]
MDAYESRKRDWEDLDVTREELKNLTECLKKEEFRKLLIEYAEEVTDPENRKIYENEITQLEKERGVDVTFVNPQPGYVIKTSVNGEKKCFLNISKSDIVARPTSHPSYEDGHRGLQWSIPYTLIPPRDDLDKKNVRCLVFDVVFHPDTIYLASKNSRFRDIVNNTAIDGVESNFKVQLDRKNLKFPKMNFKGISHPSVIRKQSKEPPKQSLDTNPEIYQKLMSSYDENREQQQFKYREEKPKRAPPETIYYKNKESKLETENGEYVTPKFLIKHQTDVDMEDFVDSRDGKMYATIPKKLVIIIDLPLLGKATDAVLDIQERSLYLKSETPAKYFLHLPLPYSIDEDHGNAKFDSKYKKLTVVLPVIRKLVMLEEMQKEDSDMDSDSNSSLPIVSNELSENLSTMEPTMSDSLSNLVLEEKTIPMDTIPINNSETSDNNVLWTTNSLETTIPFMNTDIKYTLPSFACNMYDNQIAFTVNVKNVDPDSIKHRILKNNIGIHILLASMGAGFFPQHYSLCFKVEESFIEKDSLIIEPWDNNLVFSIKLNNSDNVSHYLVGVNEEFMERKELSSTLSFKNKLKELMNTEEKDSEIPLEVNVQKEDNSVIINIRSNQLDSDDEHEEDEQNNVNQNRKGIIKSRSVSESSGDELPSSSGSMSKGILKLHRTHDFSRSVSESSADENGVVISSADFSCSSIHDPQSESECCSLKKTVRFNNVVSRQLFRSNSSILGQRKKNQRKLRNKKRAHERKLSESENSETEERDKYKITPKATSETEISENVKSILSREKQSGKQKSAYIKIKKLKKSKKLLSGKRKSSIEEESTEDTNEIAIKNLDQAEFKNDLIFDLDI